MLRNAVGLVIYSGKKRYEGDPGVLFNDNVIRGNSNVT